MVARARKRKADDNPLKSDAEDETYGTKSQRSSRKKPARARTTKPAKKKRRAATAESSASSDDADDADDDESLPDVASMEGVELDHRTGRPKRNTTRPARYNDGPDSDEGLEESADEKPPSPKPRASQRKTLMLKIKTPTEQAAPPARNTRAGSMPRSKRGQSGEPAAVGTRRSSRLHHDGQDTAVKTTERVTRSESVRRSTQSPEGQPKRQTRSHRAPPAPVVSAIHEEDEVEEPVSPEQENVAAGDPSEQEQVAEAATAKETPESENDQDDSDLPPGNPIQTSMRQGFSASKHGQILSVEDSDPDRAQKDEGSDAAENEDQVDEASPGADGAEPIAKDTEMMDAQAQLQGGGEVEQGDGDEYESHEPIAARPRRRTAKAQATGRANNRARSTKSRSSKQPQRNNQPSSDYAPEEGEESDDSSSMEESAESPQEELRELPSKRKRQRPSDIVYSAPPTKLRRTTRIDYRIPLPDEDMELNTPISRPSRGGRNGSRAQNLHSTEGPFGGSMGLPRTFGGLTMPTAGGVDSDSSDDEMNLRQPINSTNLGTAPAPGNTTGFLATAQTHSSDPAPAGAPANLGKIKDRKALADADPLGVDQNVTFDSVGGLKDHVNQLKEMVILPLLYPEIFQQFHVTPPRGVLFHGPPGTGKTLLARALAATVSSQGRKITFYMRKGADALSKWVGEAERQLRLLFEEARANQPSIIFFDEIDGLAPVRSSKQEQIHASIVSTLLALMDGMDGRGQVIVIGATNRPDTIDPALRRPGRFDREFYFPLPGREARRSIIDIHTKNWNPGLAPEFRDQLAELTKGYGGADLRALCTEAALNAVQRRYPQIYTSNVKLKIDPSSINVTAKDFMISIKKFVPSSERATFSTAAPLPGRIEPLLRNPLTDIQKLLADVLPQAKTLTALEEAEFEDDADPDGGFQRERLQQDLETSRIYRPRLLIRGPPGMGQQYLAKAILNQLEGLHVQSLDLPTLMSDPESPEAAVVKLFSEARRRKPGIIFIPDVDTWYCTVGERVKRTFLTMLRTLAPTDPVLLLGIVDDAHPDTHDPAMFDEMVKELFGFSKKNQYELTQPDKEARRAYFAHIADYVQLAPSDFPDPALRKRRIIETLEVAPPPPPPPPPTREEIRAQKHKDRLLIHHLKLRIQLIMDHIKKYRKFVSGVIKDDQIRYLFDEGNNNLTTTDMPLDQHSRPYEKACDKNGVPGLREVATNKFYYNLNIVVIEERLANGYYKRPKDFLFDIKTLRHDARLHGMDPDRTRRAEQLVSNVHVDLDMIESDPAFADCENMYQRELERSRAKGSPLAGSPRGQEARNGANVQAAAIAAGAGAAAAAQGFGPSTPMAPRDTTNPVTDPDGTTVFPKSTTISSAPASGQDSLPRLHADESSMPLAGPPGHQQNVATPSTASLTNGHVPSGSTTDAQAPLSNGSAEPSSLLQTDGGFARPAVSQQPQQQSGRAAAGAVAAAAAADDSAQPELLGNTQTSSFMPISRNSNPADFVNYASSTTTDKRSSGPQNNSGPHNSTPHSFTSSGGRIEGPDFSTYSRAQGDSQLPNTQLSTQPPGSSSTQGTGSSQKSSHPHHQHHRPAAGPGPQPPPPVPPFSAGPAARHSLSALLNHGDAAAGAAATASSLLPPPPLFNGGGPAADSGRLASGLHEQIVEGTHGFSVEQLEQLNTALTHAIWHQRHEADRGKVAAEVLRVFGDEVRDIRHMQDERQASLRKVINDDYEE